MDLLAQQHPPARHRHPQGAGECRGVVAASGGSTNAALHLPAIAHECGIEFDLFDVAEIFKRTPYIADLKPGGRYVAKDMFEAGGIPLLMKTLLDHGYLHGDCMTVTGRTIAENLAKVQWNADQDVVRPADKPITADRRRRRPARAPRAGRRHREGRRHEEPEVPRARRAASTARRTASRRSSASDYKEGDVLVIRYEGPQGRPRHARDAVDHGGALRPGHGRQGRAHHRRPLLRRDARLLHRPCRAGGGGRRADRRCCSDGDIIAIDAVKGTLDVELSRRGAGASAARPGSRARPTTSSGYLWKYAQTVGSAGTGR